MSATLPDATTAYNTLFEGVHSRVFFQKCAAAGFHPRSTEEAAWMLETAGKLRMINEHAAVKQAAARENPYYQMASGLDAVMVQYGLTPPAQPRVEVEAGFKQAADALAADPTFYNAVLSLKAAEGEQLRAEFDAWKKGQ